MKCNQMIIQVRDGMQSNNYANKDGTHSNDFEDIVQLNFSRNWNEEYVMIMMHKLRHFKRNIHKVAIEYEFYCVKISTVE